MKNILLTSFLFASVIIMIASCKKNDMDILHNPASPVGKWNNDQLILWTSIPGTATTKDTTVYTGTGSYVDLRTDENAYQKIYDFLSHAYNYDTTSYSVSGNTFTAVKGVETTVWTIQKLTGDSLQLYRKSTSNSGATINELWLIFSR